MASDLRDLLLEAAPPVAPPANGLDDARRRARTMRRRAIASRALAVPLAALVLVAALGAVNDDDRIKTLPADVGPGTTLPSVSGGAPPAPTTTVARGGSPLQTGQSTRRGGASGPAGSQQPGGGGGSPPLPPIPAAERRLAFSDGHAVWTVRLDGTDRRRVLDRGESIQGWSPDGKKLVHTSLNADRDWVVMLLDVATGKSTPLLNKPGYDHAEAAFSPDGTRIVFTRSRAPEMTDYGPAGDNEHDDDVSMFIADADGRNERFVAYGSRVSWAPDGRRLVFACTSATVNENGSSACIINDDGTGLHAVAGARSLGPFSWSPDGQWIAAIAYGSDSGGIELFRPDGSGGKYVGLAAQGLNRPAWSPDSKSIVYQRSVARPSNGVCSPNVDCDEPGGIYASAIDGSRHVRLTTSDSDRNPVIPLG